MADEFDFDQFLPANETGEEFDFDQFLPESERPGIIKRGLKWGERQLRGLSGVTPEQETTEGRVEPPPVATDPMGDSAGQAIMRSAPTPEAIPERVRDSSVFQEQPRDEGLGNVGDPLRDVGLGAANAMGDFYDPAGGNVVAGQLASKLMVPFTMAGAKGMSGSVGEAARGLNVMSELLTDGEIKLEWAKNLADWTEGQAKLVRGEINNIGDIRGVADFGTYLMERFGEGFGGFAPFLLGGVGVGVGIGAVQGIGATYNALMEDRGIQDKLKSGELTPQDVRKISLIGGAVNGLATGLMVKYIGDPGKFTKNFTRDLARLAVADPAMFASGALVNAATTELLAGYFGGNEDLAHRAANVGNATVNAFFSGVPFGAAKVAGRVERRAQERAQAPDGVDPAAAAAVSKDSGVATTPDIDPTLNAAANADVNARAKDIVARVKAQREAEEAQQGQAQTLLEAAQTEEPKFKRGVASKEAKDFLLALPEGAKLYDKEDGTVYYVRKLEDIEGSLLKGSRTNRVQIERELPDGSRAVAYRLEDSSRPKGIILRSGRFDFNRVQLEPPKEPTTARAAEDEKIKAGIEATKEPEQAAAPVDTGVTVPEAPQTLEVQYQDLTNKTRGIMLFPSKDGKPADTSVVGERPKGVFEVVHPEGTYWYRTGKGGTSKEKIEAARKDPKTLADLLGYGPSKEEVAATKKPDETPLAAVERTEDGTEVKASATNETLAPQTLEAVEANKGAPDRTVTLEPESNVIAGRAEGTGKAPEANSVNELPAALGNAASAVVDNMYGRMLERVNAGKGDDAGAPQPDLQMGVLIRKAAGRDLTLDEMKVISQRVDEIRRSGVKGPEFQKAMREAAGELQRQIVGEPAPAPKAEAAPPAPAGAGPKAAPVVVKLKSRARKDKAPEEPKTETPPVTPEVTPEPQGRILRSAEQEAALKKASEDAERGYRVTAEGDNRDFGVAPNTSDVNARKRFVTRAKAAVKAQGDAAPQYYKDAVEAKAGQTKGRTPDNIKRSKTIDEAWQQEHQANLEIIERRKVAQEEAAKAAEAPEPEPDATYKPKRTYSEDTVKRVIDAALKKATDRERAELQALPPEKLRELAQIALDQRKSDFSRGQSDVNDQQNYVQLNEERAPSSQSDVVADIAIQNKINAAGDAKGDYGVSDISETLTRRAVDTGPENTASTASANTRVYGARGLGTANESRVVKTKDGKEITVEGQKAEQGRSLSAEEKARWEAENLARAIKEAEEAVVRAQKAKAEREEMLRAHGLLKGEPVSLFDIIVAELQSNRVDRAKLADRLNAMTDEKFKNWIMRSEKGEFLSAVRANAEFPISRMQTREFRRLLNEIYNEPIYPVREMSVREAFKENRGGTKNALLDFIERRILSLIGDMKVMVVDDETIRRANILDRRNTNIQGSYDPVKNHILLNENSYVPGTAEGRKLLVHEALHGVLANALRRNPKLRDQIDKLRKLVAKELETNPELLLKYDNLDVRYGLKDPDEFISETWGNDDFRDLLSDVKISEAQMREIGLNPSQGWVRDGFRAIVDMVRQVLGSTPNTRTAIEQAIRFTDQAFEKREALGTGAAKSALTPEEMANVQAKAPDRPVYLENFAARKTTEASVRRELESRGVDRKTATELVNVLKEELGADFNFKNAKPFIDELASNFGSNEPPPPPPQAKIAAGAESIAQAMFVPTKTYKAPFKITLRFARVNELAQMADRVFGRDTNPLREISDTIQMQGREKERILKEFEPELIELSAASHKYKGKGFEDMVAIALDASRAQVHPDVPLTDPKNKHLGQEKMSGVWGKSQYPDLAARFKKLSDENPELAQIYGKVRDMLPKMLEARLEAVVSAVLRSTGIDDVAVARRFLEGKATPEDIATAGPIIVRHIKNAIDVARLNGPYFNFARRGDFVVHGRYKVEAPTNARKVSDDTFDFATRKEAEEWVQKQNLPTTLESVYIDPKTGKTEFVDADGKEVRVTAKDVEGEQRFRATVQTQYTEFVETLGQAKKRTAEMREEGLTMSDPEDRKAMTTSNWRDILPNQMRALMEMTDQRLEGSKLTSGQKNEIIGILNEFSITMLGPNRIQSSQLPRRNVAGMSTDFVRSTIEYMERSAGYMARTKYQDQMTKALKAMEERTKALSDLGTGNGTFARRIANEMEGRVIQSNAMEQPSRAGRIIDRLNALSYADKLLSLGYSITNLTQTMYTFAELGGDHGATISAFHITKAYNDVSAGRVLGRGGVETVKAAIGKDGNAPYIEQIKARLTPKEAELLDFLVERGVVDPDAGFDMAMIKRQRDGKDTLFAKSVAGMDKGIDYLSNVARALPRAVEAVNRTVAALAAYRLEMRRNGGDHEKAMMYAQDVVSNSQFNSSPTNVPPDFRNPWLRAPLQFKLFLQGSMHAVGRQVGRAIRNESPGDRIKGIRALAIYVAGYQAMAGVLGLPGVELVKLALLLANALNLSDFKPSDFEQMVRRYATEMLGKGGGELATRGLTRAIGIDTSNRLGFPTVTFGEPRGDTEDAAWAYIAKTAAGAPASYIIDVGKGFRAAMDGEWKKAAELTIPIKTISDYIKADRLSEEGKKSAAGRQTMTPYSTSEKVTRIIGFTPAREAEEFEERSAKQSAVAEYNKQRQKLISDWVANPNNRAKAMIAIEKFNRDKPSEAQIDMKDLRNSEKRRQTEEKRGTVVNGIRTNKRNKYLVEEIDVYNTRK